FAGGEAGRWPGVLLVGGAGGGGWWATEVLAAATGAMAKTRGVRTGRWATRAKRASSDRAVPPIASAAMKRVFHTAALNFRGSLDLKRCAVATTISRLAITTPAQSALMVSGTQKLATMARIPKRAAMGNAAFTRALA